MWLSEEIPETKYSFVINPQLVNGPGFLGFAPDKKYKDAWKELGAFITNPISYRPRYPAADCCCLPFTGGFLLHNGFPNPGYKDITRKFREIWRFAELSIIVHLLFEEIASLQWMITDLEGMDNIIGIEISFHPSQNFQKIIKSIEGISSELPIMLYLNPYQTPLFQEPSDTGNNFMIHLAAPYGLYTNSNNRTIKGRLFGPALFPQSLLSIRECAELGYRVIAGGGVSNRSQVNMMLDEGALGVSLDYVLWSGNFNL